MSLPMRSAAENTARGHRAEVVTVRYRRVDVLGPPAGSTDTSLGGDSGSTSSSSDEERGAGARRRRGWARGRGGSAACCRTSPDGGRRACVATTACCVVLLLIIVGMVVDRPGYGGGGLGTTVTLPPHARARLRRERYFIALNAYNSEATLTTAVPQLLRLVKTLGASRCMVSVYENGEQRWAIVRVCGGPDPVYSAVTRQSVRHAAPPQAPRIVRSTSCRCCVGTSWLKVCALTSSPTRGTGGGTRAQRPACCVTRTPAAAAARHRRLTHPIRPPHG